MRTRRKTLKRAGFLGGKMIKKICQDNKFPTHEEARKIIKQLKTNPEVCEKCNIKPCKLANYLWGK